MNESAYGSMFVNGVEFAKFTKPMKLVYEQLISYAITGIGEKPVFPTGECRLETVEKKQHDIKVVKIKRRRGKMDRI